MGDRYTDRDPKLNMDNRIVFRVSDYQYNKLMEYSRAFDMPVSVILREAVSIWININHESLVKAGEK